MLVSGLALTSVNAAEREQVRMVVSLIAGVKMPFIETALALKRERRAIESSLILISPGTLLHSVGKSGV